MIERSGLLKIIIIFRIKLAVTFKKYDRKPIYNRRLLKTKIKAYGDDATSFFDKVIPNTCLAVIIIVKR